MHIKAKLYPYPVLAGFNNDYYDSEFNVYASIQTTPSELLIHFKKFLNNNGLQSLIDDKKASVIVHIECPLTSYRKVLIMSQDELDYSISADLLEGPISFCPFIVAMQDVLCYKNDKFNSDYDDSSFDIERGNILAIGQEVCTRVEKEDDNLSSIPSIFAVTEVKDENCTDIIINNTGNKINIQLPTNTFFEFKLAMSNPSSMAVLHSIIIIPALMKCFDDMKSKPEELYIYEDKRWFRALKKALKKLNIELSEETILSLDSFIVSQKLMDNTTNRAILEINNIAFNGGTDDE